MRILASIQKITNIKPIPEADKIEVATLLGWNVVVRKNEFKVGDLVVYCEVDSILPFAPWSDFLRDKNNPDKPIRLRTMRIRGQISQGICFPLNILPDGAYSIGDGVTSILGITKYDPPIPACLSGEVEGMFPTSLIPKTDEMRIQSAPDVLNRYPEILWYRTEKVDGSSGTFLFIDGKFSVCSRSLILRENLNNTFWKVAAANSLKEKLEGTSFAVQGEVIGEGIQGNKYKLKGQHLYVFNVFDILAYRYLDYSAFFDFCSKKEIKTVPIIEINKSLKGYSIESLLKEVDCDSVLFKTPCEGNVYRSMNEMRDPDLGRLSFKVINNNFLLKNKE